MAILTAGRQSPQISPLPPDVPDCGCKLRWVRVEVGKTVDLRIAGSEPCPHVCRCDHHTPLSQWASALLKQYPDEYEDHPEPARAELMLTPQARLCVMMLRWSRGEQVFHECDVYWLPRIAAVEMADGTVRLIPDSDASRPSRGELPSDTRRIPPAVVRGAQALASLMQTTRIICRSPRGQWYIVDPEGDNVTDENIAEAVLWIKPERLGRLT